VAEEIGIKFSPAQRRDLSEKVQSLVGGSRSGGIQECRRYQWGERLKGMGVLGTWGIKQSVGEELEKRKHQGLVSI